MKNINGIHCNTDTCMIYLGSEYDGSGSQEFFQEPQSKECFDLTALTFSNHVERLSRGSKWAPIKPYFEAMPVHYSDLAKLNFDQDAYSKDLPLGTWKAKVEQAVYSRGAKTHAWLLRGRADIHLYVQHESGWRIWLSVSPLPSLASFSVATKLNAGDIIEVEIVFSKTGIPVVKQLRKGSSGIIMDKGQEKD